MKACSHVGKRAKYYCRDDVKPGRYESTLAILRGVEGSGPVFGRGILLPPRGGGYQAASSERGFENGGGARQGITPIFLHSRSISGWAERKDLICIWPPHLLHWSGSISKMRFIHWAQLRLGFVSGSGSCKRGSRRCVAQLDCARCRPRVLAERVPMYLTVCSHSSGRCCESSARNCNREKSRCPTRFSLYE